MLWIDPPNDKPPVPIHERVEHPEGLRWVPDQPLTEGLRARNTQIEATSVFDNGPGTIRGPRSTKDRSWWRVRPGTANPAWW